jgi:hypothetical protein
MSETIYYVNAINNSAGTLFVMENALGKYFWQMEEKKGNGTLGYANSLWAEIPKTLFDELVKHPDTIKETKKVF